MLLLAEQSALTKIRETQGRESVMPVIELDSEDLEAIRESKGCVHKKGLS